METLECIKTRRSRRKFLDKEVPQEIIEKIIEAGKCAPSGDNKQPWKFYIIREKNIKKAIVTLDDVYNKQIIPGCDFILIVGVDTNLSPISYIEDGVIAAQNVLLACHDLGLGAVYLSGFNLKDPQDAKGIQKAVNIPDSIMPISMLLIGYPDPHEQIGSKSLKNNKDLIEYR
ncbi:MAG: nitroreductase family protein [Candidatus Parcubacteria bacterium]|nr:nitroreductase family protein [Candidatus Parcubacteria bacterium]